MDKKAKDILFKTYWRNGRWVMNSRTTEVADFEYAKSKGLMFDNLTITHDECINEIFKIAEKISIDKVSQAFLSSLSNKRLDWRYVKFWRGEDKYNQEAVNKFFGKYL